MSLSNDLKRDKGYSFFPFPLNTTYHSVLKDQLFYPNLQHMCYCPQTPLNHDHRKFYLCFYIVQQKSKVLIRSKKAHTVILVPTEP